MGCTDFERSKIIIKTKREIKEKDGGGRLQLA
jgi:hypothetical protein